MTPLESAPPSHAAPDAPHAATPMNAATPPDSSPENAPEAYNPDELPTWEDDETHATLFLRAACTFLMGGFLLWAQWHSEAAARPAQLWSQWVQLALMANLAIPLGVVWLFFGQGLRTPEWMRDAKHNAWSYGWNARGFKRHFGFALVALLVMLPLLWFASRNPNTRETYNAYLPPTEDARSLLLVLGGLIVYLFCWEWFFRGFLLFGMAQGVGVAASVVAQAGLFCAAHAGKPPLEMLGAFFGGLILGIVCWREKSFLPAFYAHTLIHAAWVLLLR